MENAPEAAPQGTEVNPTPTTNEPAAAPVTEAPQAPVQTGPVANIPTDQIDTFNRFIESNGGYEKAFAKLKTAVSAPEQQQAPASVQAPVQAPVAPQQPMAQMSGPMTQIPEGFVAPQEVVAMGYFDRLSQDPKYAAIADEIKSGKIVDEMTDLGINTTQNGLINDKNIRKFLNFKVQSVPAKPTSTPISTTPTVEYVNVGEKINSLEAAMQVISQNQGLAGKGVADHPLTQQAKEFIKNHYSSGK